MACDPIPASAVVGLGLILAPSPVMDAPASPAPVAQAADAPVLQSIVVSGSGSARRLSLPVSSSAVGPLSVAWGVVSGPSPVVAVHSPVVQGGAGAVTLVSEAFFPLAGTYVLRATVSGTDGQTMIDSAAIMIDAAGSVTVSGQVEDDGAGRGGLSVVLRWTADVDGDGRPEAVEAPIATDSTSADVPAGDAVGAFRFSGLTRPLREYVWEVPPAP